MTRRKSGPSAAITMTLHSSWQARSSASFISYSMALFWRSAYRVLLVRLWQRPFTPSQRIIVHRSLIYLPTARSTPTNFDDITRAHTDLPYGPAYLVSDSIGSPVIAHADCRQLNWSLWLVRWRVFGTDKSLSLHLFTLRLVLSVYPFTPFTAFIHFQESIR